MEKVNFKKILSVLMAICIFAGSFYGISITGSAYVGNEKRGSIGENHISDGGFESYSDNTDLKSLSGDNKWYSATSDNTDWPAITVSTDKAEAGQKSLKSNSIYNGFYRTVSGLSQNTDYVLVFSYYMDTYSEENTNRMDEACVYAGSATPKHNGGASDSTGILGRNSIYAIGQGKWITKQVVFNTGSETSVKAFFCYSSKTDSMYIDSMGLYKISECVPYSESDICPVTVNGNTEKNTIDLVANDTLLPGVHFRAWQYKDIDVSTNTTFELEDAAEVDKYAAVAYNYNFLKNNVTDDGTFEKYAAGTDMENEDLPEGWFSTSTDEWPGATITADKAYSGEKSLCISSQHNAIYRNITGLKKFTGYKITFKYLLENYTSENAAFLKNIAVIPQNFEIDSLSNINKGTYYSLKQFNESNGSCSNGNWKTAEIDFVTDNERNVKFSLLYNFNTGTDSHLYIDNFSIEECASAVNNGFVYGNFENGSATGWNPTAQSISITPSSDVTMSGNYCGKITSTETFKNVYAAPVAVKKGFTYKFSFMANLKDYDSTAYFDFAVTENGKHNNLIYNAPTTSNPELVNAYGTFETVSGTRIKSFNIYNYNSCTSKKDNTSNAIGKGENFVVTVTYTAEKDTIACLSLMLNAASTIYIDNYKVTATKTDSVILNDLFEYRGHSIRVDNDDTQGLRSKTAISKKFLCSGNEYGLRAVEYGTIAIRKDLVGEKELIVDKDQNTTNGVVGRKGVAYSIDGSIDHVFTTEEKSIVFTGVLIGINDRYLNSNYCIRPYAILENGSGTQGIYYGDITEASVVGIAKIAYNAKKSDGSFAETKAVRDFLYTHFINTDTFVDTSITVKNNSAPLSTSFLGMNATVYHCFAFMNDDYGRAYNGMQIATEMDRLKESGIASVRSMIPSQYAWNSQTNSWDWDSENMQRVYKWAKELAKRDISIIWNLGWYITFYQNEFDSSSANNILAGATYLYGNGSDIYGESADLTNPTRIQKASRRYGEWASQLLLALRQRGIYNSEYLLPFTEPSYETETKPQGEYADTYIEMVKGLNDVLKSKGIRNDYKIVGPNQFVWRNSSGTGTMIDYYLTYIENHPEYDGIIDILSQHQYAKGTSGNTKYDIDDETYYADYYDSFHSGYRSVLDRHNFAGDFWVDEFGSSSPKLTSRENQRNGNVMVQNAVAVASGMNNGLERIMCWALFDQLWPNHTSTGGEFIDGVHATGFAPRLISHNTRHDYNISNGGQYLGGYTPYVNYYGFGLLARLLGSRKGGKTFETTVSASSGVYASCTQRDDGKYAVLVINTKSAAQNIKLIMEKSVTTSIKRYQYNPKYVVQNEDAKQILSDVEILPAENNFIDSIPSMSFAIYVFGKGGEDSFLDVTEDVDDPLIDMDE